MEKLTDEEIAIRLAELDEWVMQDERIEKEYEFADFQTAMSFMNLLVPTADALNHHPDWSNSYNRVHISLTSHDAGGLTDADFQFAAAADEVMAQL